jgi:RHS repeat-associated protein
VLAHVSATTNHAGGDITRQEFDVWGKQRITAAQGTPPLVSRRNYTGQILDATGLLFYNARYYDPGIGRFLSADTVVPGAPSGTMNGVAVTPLTVDFHESGFRSKLNSESKAPFWFQMNGDARQQHGSPMGPANPQALNRYSYVQNNPLKYTDPTGHVAYQVSYDHLDRLITQFQQEITMLLGDMDILATAVGAAATAACSAGVVLAIACGAAASGAVLVAKQGVNADAHTIVNFLLDVKGLARKGDTIVYELIGDYLYATIYDKNGRVRETLKSDRITNGLVKREFSDASRKTRSVSRTNRPARPK